MPRSGGGDGSKLYWRSLDDLADTPEFRDFVFREFPAGATEMLSSSDRRQFLKIMGASMALAGLGLPGCRRWPQEHIAPYAHRPEGHTPGTTGQYATCMEIGGVAAGLLVTSYDFRPIKIDGNPLHPMNGNAAELPQNLDDQQRRMLLHGSTDPYMQAAILDLYDPDRSRAVLHKGEKSSWNDFVKWWSSPGSETRGAIAILAEASSSPSVEAMRKRLTSARSPVKWYEYEPIKNDNALRGSMMAFDGVAMQPRYHFDRAQTVVALDADFLHCDAAALRWTRDFAKKRRANTDQQMARLYAFESTLSITGANADHRVAVRSSDVAVIAARLAMEFVQGASASIQELAGKSIRATVGGGVNLDQVVQHLRADLGAQRGASVIIAGPRQPAEVHLLAHLLNHALGNVGKTVVYTPWPAASAAQGHLQAISGLAADIKAGAVQTLVIIGGNPAYNAPADLGFAQLLQTVPASVHLSDYVDETSRLCTWHVNRAHFLEAWGDGRAYDGTVSIAQPLIEPLFDGKSAIELLAAVTGDELTKSYDIVRRTFGERAGAPPRGNFERNWRHALHDGVVAGTAHQPQSPRITANANQSLRGLQDRWLPAQSNQIEVVFTQDFSVYDGRFANNGWLQELPNPIAKTTWDNAIWMNPGTAAELGVKTGDMATLQLNGREITAAVLLLPGHAEGSVTLPLGYGRDVDGRIAAGAGFNFYKLRTTAAMSFAPNATIAKAAGSYVLALTQDHFPIDSFPAGQGIQERLPTLFREASLDEYRKHPDFAKHPPHAPHGAHRLSLWKEKFAFHDDVGRPAEHAWGMAIDLNSCTGCHACVIACQAENNIPIVGKDQVKRGREMHWLRVDRYFKGGTEVAPDAYTFAPIPCMHCENAPCEQVCPVAATVHDADGLNVMVYNRCVGTRYCSNNCPYKVRRFNYFDYHARLPHREQPGMLLQVEPDYYAKPQAQADPLKQMQFNPDVTVRMRGIMEKCTYCVQRITKAKIEAKNEWVRQNQPPTNGESQHPTDPPGRMNPIPDGAIVTACAQACPAEAIVFGDLNDPNSRVSQLHAQPRAYEMLEELNTKPRTRFLAKIRNPAFAKGDAAGHG